MKTFDEAIALIQGSGRQVDEVAARYDCLSREVYLHKSVCNLAVALLHSRIDVASVPEKIMVDILWAMASMLFTGVVIGIEMEKVEAGGVVAG